MFEMESEPRITLLLTNEKLKFKKLNIIRFKEKYKLWLKYIPFGDIYLREFRDIPKFESFYIYVNPGYINLLNGLNCNIETRFFYFYFILTYEPKYVVMF
ncbi:MAG: hypothetical protein RMJ67_01340 [Elusimicrobiota bacterium]|nr:hypothetical protein [Endomicrobiia bacterium]MDW8165148.1 hypothetical protein [Elusimicrobiota bacterium]